MTHFEVEMEDFWGKSPMATGRAPHTHPTIIPSSIAAFCSMVQKLGFGAQDSGYKAFCSMVQISGFRGSGFRVQSLGFGVLDLGRTILGFLTTLGATFSACEMINGGSTKTGAGSTARVTAPCQNKGMGFRVRDSRLRSEG